MWIMIAGPYRSGSTDPAVWAANPETLNRAAVARCRLLQRTGETSSEP